MARKILLADDSVTAQNMGRKILADAGYEVITVNNGSAALKKIAEQKPDLIVLDVYMPGYSGLEVCQRLKEAAETSRLPILLTVGKLEPFKPDEAKRVRADGFIVKPFEASELLSALSKLEDKIVPRSEASKPGRLARVSASVEDGRYDRIVANEDDMGWKDRISFPPKKKKQSDEPSTVFDAPIVIEHKLADQPSAAKAEEARVDLGALAPEGLPKDVTPEEIAALAAAAAQVKGKIAASQSGEPALVEARTESTEPAQFGAAFPAPVNEHQSEEKFTEETQAPQEKFNEAAVEAASMTAASPLDVIAAITGLSATAAASPASPAESSGNGFSPHAVAEQSANEPVTMARAGSEASRWVAVSVGLDPQEAAISLEHEMQKAYAAFAAAVNGQAPTAISENETDSRRSATAAEFSPSPEPALPVESIPALPVPNPPEIFNGLANASTETIRAVVQNLEMVAEPYPGETNPPAAADFEQATPDPPQIPEAVALESSTEAAGQLQPPSEQFGTAQNHESDFRHEELKKQDQESEARKNEDWKKEDWKQEDRSVATNAAEHNEASAITAERHGTAAPPLVNEASAEQATTSHGPSHTEAVAASEPAAEGTGAKTAETESEASATTAAAWASWRQIRESGNPEVVSEERSRKDSEEVVQPQAAMAVAAGAEKTPDEISAESNSDSDPAAIASIVDSVLADLRPKIFEEISRKMGKRK